MLQYWFYSTINVANLTVLRYLHIDFMVQTTTETIVKITERLFCVKIIKTGRLEKNK